MKILNLFKKNTKPPALTENIPKKIPACLMDRLSAVLGLVSNMMLQLELEFDEQLDAKRLAKAFELVVDVEPVLGCKYVENWRKPYWKRLEKSEREIFIFTKGKKKYLSFKNEPINFHNDTQIKACLWRSKDKDKDKNKDKDRLLLKITDVVTDAGGVKEIAGLVSNIYSRLVDEPDYRPKPNLTGSRSLWQVLRHIPWHAYQRCFSEKFQDMRSLIKYPVSQSLQIKNGPNSPLAFIQKTLSKDHVSRISKYGRSKQATLNDMMVAAFLRALGSKDIWDGQKQFRLITTIDLRRHIPSGHAKGITTLSTTTSGWLNIGTKLGSDFETTLARVTSCTRPRKEFWLGITDSLGFLFFQTLPHFSAMKLIKQTLALETKSGNFTNCLTNLGQINPDNVTFGARPVNACLLPPSNYPPRFAAGLSGYLGTLCLSAGVYPTQKKIVEDFFDRVISELPK